MSLLLIYLYIYSQNPYFVHMYIRELMTFCHRKIRLAAPIFKHLLQSSVHKKHFLQRILHLLNRRTFAKLCIHDERTTQYFIVSRNLINRSVSSKPISPKIVLQCFFVPNRACKMLGFFIQPPACANLACTCSRSFMILIPMLITDCMRPVTITECAFFQKKKINLRL